MERIDAVLGIDIGGTNTKFGLSRGQGEVLFQESIPTDSRNTSPAALIGRIFERIEARTAEMDAAVEITGVGIGAPNANYYTGRIENPPNLHWETADLPAVIGEHLDRPVAVTNDANASALGEMWFGAAKGMRHFIQLTLGTGLGSGFVVDGELVYGHDGFSGEMGHITAVRGGRRCACGKRGCLETYVSANGLKRTAFELLAEFTDESPLRGISYADLTSERIFESARDGDAVSAEAFRRTGDLLGEAIADVVALFSPEAVILFGGVMAAGDLILAPVKERMEANLFPVFRGKVKILPSKLPGDKAAILGAAALIRHELEVRGQK